MKPLAIDLFCGLGGWAEGLLAEGWDVVGFDIERHVYGEDRYPASLVLQDVRTLVGSQFAGASLIVASPPCQAYSYRAMPWKRAKALPPPDNELFEMCFRLQREACEAAGRHVPLIVENVRGAQRWVGRARWNFGSFYLWGDVPALMVSGRHVKQEGAPSWFYNNYEMSSRRQQGAAGVERDDREDTSAAVAVDRADVLPGWEGCGMMIVLVTAFTIAGQDFESREVVPSFEVCWARAAVRMEELLRGHSGVDRIGVGCWLDAGKPA